ncbi:MAG: response regulator [Pseudomonadota bacterium]
MRVLIVESDPNLGSLWARHLHSYDVDVNVAHSQDDAIGLLAEKSVDIIVLDIVIDGGSAFAVADYASYRHPDTRVIFVTRNTFFSDGSIFRHIPNACAYIGASTRPDDLAAMVEHYGRGLEPARPH